jgi:hypothetical protein
LAVLYTEKDLKGMRFVTMEDIKSNGMAELRKIPEETFRR